MLGIILGAVGCITGRLETSVCTPRKATSIVKTPEVTSISESGLFITYLDCSVLLFHMSAGTAADRLLLF